MEQAIPPDDARRAVGPDVVGYRPQEREPVGFVELLSGVPAALRGHWGRIVGLAALLLLCYGILGAVTNFAWFAVANSLWFPSRGYLPAPFFCGSAVKMAVTYLLLGPLVVGYAWAVLRLLQGKRAGAGTLLEASAGWRRLASVLVAVLPAVLAESLFRLAFGLVLYGGPTGPAGRFLSFLAPVLQVPVAGMVLNALPSIALEMALAPLEWAGLEVMVAGRSGLEALKRSVRLAIRNPGLLAGMMATVGVARLADKLAQAPVEAAMYLWARSGGGPTFLSPMIVICSQAILVLVVGFASTVVVTVVLVLVYREMVWRERDALLAGP
jgi:hypothetical protein